MSATKKNINKEILALFSGQASMVTTPKLYVQLAGNHSLAVVLNQCVFWSNKSDSKDGWFHKEYEEWFEEIHIPERTLRRRFDRLEQRGWISTKVKKVGGLNIKHIYTHIDRIIEAISNMLEQDCPNRPECPVRTDNKQKSCTKIAPTGHFGRLEPATLSDSSIYTDEYIQIKTTNCESSSSFFFSETLDAALINQKLFSDERSDDEFMEHVVDHVDNHSDKQYSRIVRAQGALKLLKKLKIQSVKFYAKGRQPKEVDAPKKPKQEAPFTQEELALVQEYKHAKKMEGNGQSFCIFMPNKDKVAQAEEIIERINAMEAPQCLIPSPLTNARRNSLNLVSNMVSHLALSQ